MNTSHEDAVLNFDLDFLHPSTSNNSGPTTKLKCITQLKRRIIRVDALQAHCNSSHQELTNNIKEIEELKKKLQAITEDHKQLRIDYKESLENCTRFEREIIQLKAKNEKLKDENAEAVNNCEATKSHLAQLEQLYKNERKTESHDKIEKKKPDKMIVDKCIAEKGMLQWKKKYEAIQKELEELKCFHSKSNKEELRKNKRFSNKTTNEPVSPDHSDNEDDVVIPVSNQNSSEINVDTTQKSSSLLELDITCNNEVPSTDLGYGSSLTSSDNEKCLNSPDYILSPIHRENIEKYRSLKLVTTATSPIPLLKITTATSPIQLLKVTTATSPIKLLKVTTATSPIHSLKVNTGSSPIQSVKMINVAISPIITQFEMPNDSKSQTKSTMTDDRAGYPTKSIIHPVTNNVIEIADSPVEMIETVCPINIQDNTNDTQDAAFRAGESLSNIPCIEITPEKECLELNNSNNMDEDCSTNNEVEMILNTMRLNYSLITPIPRTPGKSSSSSSSHGCDPQCSVDAKRSTCVDAIARAEAASLKAEAVKYIEGINMLKNEILSIKNLINQKFMPDTVLEFNQTSLSTNLLLNNDNNVNISHHETTNKTSLEHLNKPVASNRNVSQAIPTFPLDKKITIISEEIIQPADTSNLINKQDEYKIIPNTSQEMKFKDSAGQSIGYLEAGDTNFNNDNVVEMKSPTKDVIDRKGKRNKKTTCLAKYRQKCELRKYKIKREAPPLVKRLKKPKQVQLFKHVTERDTSATLNDSQVYANAVKVMAELNAKSKAKYPKKPSAGKEHNNNYECLPNAASKSNITLLESGTTDLTANATLPESLTMSTNPELSVVLKNPVNFPPRCSMSLEKSVPAPPKATIICRKRSIQSPEFPVAPLNSANIPIKCSGISSAVIDPFLKPTNKTSKRSNISPELSAALIESSSKHSVESSETNVPSLKHKITSPRPSIRSPDPPVLIIESATSPSKYSLKSPQTTVSCQKYTITSPKIRSPELPVTVIKSNTISLKDSVKSPHTVSSLKPTISPAGPSIRSPELPVEIMESAIIPSKPSLKSPKTVSSPKSTTTSPKQSIASQEFPVVRIERSITPLLFVTSPETSISSPKSTITSPRQSITSPEFPVVCIERSITPLLFATSPETTISSPKFTITSPRQSITSPENTVLPLKATITSPIQSSRSPDLPNTLKEPMNIPLEPIITSPENTIPFIRPMVTYSRRSLKFSELSAKIIEPATTPSKDTVPYPKSQISSPRHSIRSPDLPIAFMNPDITTLKNSVNSLGLSVPSSTPSNTLPRRSPRSPEYRVTTTSEGSSKILNIAVSCPQQSIAPPKAAITFPNYSIKTDGASRLTAITSPKHVMTSTEVPVTSSNPNDTSISYIATPSKPVNTFPDPGNICSRLPVSSTVYAITSSKLDNSAPVSCRITKSRSKCKNDISKKCFVEFDEDAKSQNIPQNKHATNHDNIKENRDEKISITQIIRKRPLPNSPDLNCMKIPSKKQLMGIEVNTTMINKNIEKISSGKGTKEDTLFWNGEDSVLCDMISKYGVKTIKNNAKSVPGPVLNKISETIEKYVLKTKDTSKERQLMNELLAELQLYDFKTFVTGVIHYLINPERKMELFAKSLILGAPPMSRAEQIMLYVLRQLRHYWGPVDAVKAVLLSIEHIVLRLNKTPEFGVIESVSHFYALVCRYFNLKSELIMYMLDAMYCIQFKSVSLIKQCLDVWPQVIPLAHMRLAKLPLVTCFVYLLHFYKVNQDKYNRVQDIRNMLNRRYFYQITEWNETKILELFRLAIVELKNIPIEIKMLRLALIIFAKRQGPKWTQNNLIKKIILPIIDNEKMPNNVRVFCISIIGPLTKPYPADMKANCECTMNQLLDILKSTTSTEIEEAAMSSLIIMSRHNQNKVIEMLLRQKLRPMSPEFEKLLFHFVRSKPLHAWLKIFSRMAFFDNEL